VNKEEIELVVVTGMSGAGKSTAARALEDRGWFVIDNLPPALLGQVLAEMAQAGLVTRLAVVVDARGGPMFDELSNEIHSLRSAGANVRVVYLEAGSRPHSGRAGN